MFPLSSNTNLHHPYCNLAILASIFSVVDATTVLIDLLCAFSPFRNRQVIYDKKSCCGGTPWSGGGTVVGIVVERVG